jgi:regulatory protein
VRRRPRPEVAAKAALADERSVRTVALALLAGRDFSRQELTERLVAKGYVPEIVDAAVAELVAEGLLREERYAERFVTQKSGRGRGPVRIRMDLRQKGVDAEAIDTALKESDVDWTAAARATRIRRFGPEMPADRRERAKQARFLQYRGFSSDQIRAALGPGEDDQAPDRDP